MRQHTATFAAVLLLTANIPQAQASERCELLSVVAEHSVLARYDGVRLRDLLREVPDGTVVRSVITSAFAGPTVNGRENQVAVARRYGDLVMVECERGAL